MLQNLGYVEQRGTGIVNSECGMRNAELSCSSFIIQRLWRLALAYLRVNVQMTNADYRRLHPLILNVESYWASLATKNGRDMCWARW